MARKLVFVLSLVAAVAVVTGCKEEKNTSMNFDAKGAYQQGQQDKYKQNVGTAGAKATTTEP